MNVDKLNRWLTLAANLGVIVGILFLALEIQLSNRIAKSEMDRSRISNNIAFLGLTGEFADIWARGLAGDELSQAELVAFDGLVMMRWGQMYASTESQESYHQDIGRRIGLYDFASFLHQNPGARARWEYLMGREQRYRQFLIKAPVGVEYMQVVQSALIKLDNGSF